MTHCGGDRFPGRPRTLLLGWVSGGVTTAILATAAVGQVHPRLADGGSPPLTEAATVETPAETLPTGPSAVAGPMDLDRYVYDNLFSIGFPDGWQVTEQAQSPQITGSSTANAPAIRTEVTWYPTPPQGIVSEALQTIQANGYTVARYDAVNIDGTTALRIWLTDLPDGRLPNSLTSFVGYTNATAVITSYYGEGSHDLDDLLSSIHQSFQRLSQAESP